MTIKRAPGIFAAVVGVSAVVTAGFGWAEVLAGWAVCALLRLMKKDGEETEYSGFTAALVVAIGVLLLGIIVQGAEKAFPGDETFPFVSAGLLILLYKLLSGEKETTAIVTNVLGLILLGLLGCLTVFGMENVSWKENIPRGFRWDRMLISFVVSSPWWIGKAEGDGKWFLASGLLAVGMSLVTRGILGTYLTEYSAMPLYKAVQTIHVLGTLQRLEAVLAAAVLLGVFSMMGFVGSEVVKAGENLFPGKEKRFWLLLLLTASFLTEIVIMYLKKGTKEQLTTIFWGLIPIFALWMVIYKKDKKVLDKMDDMM